MLFGEVATISGDIILLVVEVGYALKFFQIQCRFLEYKTSIKKGDKVTFNGAWLEGGQFSLLSLKVSNFNQCELCGAPYVGDCEKKHQTKTVRVQGVWKVVHKREDHRYTRLWFELVGDVKCFAYTTKSDALFHKELKKFQVGDYSEMDGWLTEPPEIKYFRSVK